MEPLIGFDERIETLGCASRYQRLPIERAEPVQFVRFCTNSREFGGNALQDDAGFQKITDAPKAQFRDEVAPPRNHCQELFVIKAIAGFAKWCSAHRVPLQDVALLQEFAFRELAVQNSVFYQLIRA